MSKAAQQYLERVGQFITDLTDLDDRTWTACLAIAYSEGFITGFDWESDFGKALEESISIYLAESPLGRSIAGEEV